MTRTTIYDVWGSGPTDVFAVGLDNSSYPYMPVILHHDGSSWTSMAVPAGPQELYGVWGSGPTDVYAVGCTSYPVTGVILHYDGSNWTSVFAGGLRLTAVSGSGPANVWVLDQSGPPLHYDGVSWTRQPAGLFSYYEVGGIWASGSEAYIVGRDAYMNTAMVLRFTGQAWVKVPMPLMPKVSLSTIWGSHPYDIFVGGLDTSVSPNRTALLHYDGSTWTWMDSGTTAACTNCGVAARRTSTPWWASRCCTMTARRGQR